MEDDISGDVHLARINVKTFITFVILTIPEKYTLLNEVKTCENYRVLSLENRHTRIP
jgi:hypothetical protein